VLPATTASTGFAAPRPVPSGPDLSSAGLAPHVIVADLDRDGADDIYASSRDFGGSPGGRRLLRGHGDLSFSAPVPASFYDLSWARGATRSADINRDGALDTVELVAQTVHPYTVQTEVHYGLWPLLRPAPAGLADIDMGAVAVGASSLPRAVVFVNDGPETATDLLVFAAGEVDDFSPDGDTCTGSSLAVDASCSVSVRFTPRNGGERVLALAVAGAESDELEWSPVLFGTGLTPGPGPLPPAPATRGTQTSTRPVAGTLTRAGKPRIRRRGRRARFNTGWVLACPGGSAPCRADVSVATTAKPRRKSVVLARGSASVAPGVRRALVVSLSRAGVSALRRHRHLSAALTITATRSGANPASARASVTLRWPRRG
jgi:hypothetical protein